MRALRPALAVAFFLTASGAAPAAVVGSPPLTVLEALPGKTPSPATGQEAVAIAQACEGLPSALARPYKAELSWTAQWQGGGWWLVGVFESDWGTRFVVRALVEGRHVKFGAGPTRQWILDNAQPQVTTLCSRCHRRTPGQGLSSTRRSIRSSTERPSSCGTLSRLPTADCRLRPGVVRRVLRERPRDLHTRLAADQLPLTDPRLGGPGCRTPRG